MERALEYPDPTMEGEEVNGFGLTVIKMRYSAPSQIYRNPAISQWLMFSPGDRWRHSRSGEKNDIILLNLHCVTLAFGALISPHQFKCAGREFYKVTNLHSRWKLVFFRHNSFLGVDNGVSQFKMKRDHIDHTRGVIIDIQSTTSIIVHVSLRGNLDEYKSGGMST